MPLLGKDALMHLAEQTGVSAGPMAGTGGGPYHYDGWSGVRQLLEGPSPLVRKVGRDRIALTTLPNKDAGRDVAAALHTIAHANRRCRCGEAAGAAAAVVGLREVAGSAFLDPIRHHHGPRAAEAEADAATPFATESPRQPPAGASRAPLLAAGLAADQSPSLLLAPRPTITHPLAIAAGPAHAPEVPKTRKVVACGRCGGIGHNARNAICPLRGTAQEEAASVSLIDASDAAAPAAAEFAPFAATPSTATLSDAPSNVLQISQQLSSPARPCQSPPWGHTSPIYLLDSPLSSHVITRAEIRKSPELLVIN
jgi:hypothetical protein